MGATLSLAYRGSLDLDHILYGLLSGPSDTHQMRLRSRCPFVPAVQNLLDNLTGLGTCTSEWTNHKGKVEYCEMLPGSVFLCLGRPVPGLLGWAYLKQLGLSSTDSGLVLGDFICPCTDGVSLLHRIASVAPSSKPQNMF